MAGGSTSRFATGTALKQLPTGNIKRGAVGPGHVIGQNRGDRCAYVTRQTDTPQGDALCHIGVHVFVVAHCAAAKIGCDGTRGNGIHANLTRAELYGHVTGQHFQRRFYRGIEAVAGQGETHEA
ncbi:Superfamily I DNA and/or RNA helicase [Pseudomonas syringae pv. actinidiae]|uniref:Superfamily I DNA and/or RNA helicase n=1 Tax=Pseudomonas syringae pv. actinidiae TaxID=103796 RepID=A0A2V0QC40_PSESF|nr:Superfamily I DNA and/or RNA helicase [Pseudomonas syringae pv. actinidiae]